MAIFAVTILGICCCCWGSALDTYFLVFFFTDHCTKGVLRTIFSHHSPFAATETA